MQGVGPGSLLGGRYAVRERLSQHPQWERWSASDTALDREVVLLCFPRSAAQADAALDAARRAAGVEEFRLTRVLDVGLETELVFVVEEPMPGAATLTALLAEGGLPADEVRRIVGDAAGGLAAASSRGLHHAVLTPRDVLVLPDGTVKVRGLATEAALLGEDDRPAEDASRADAVALAGLLYAGLTGRWPLPGSDSGLEAAPRMVSGVAAPSEIAAGVPYDIDVLVTAALAGDGGPRSPAEVADQLFPGGGPGRARLAPGSVAAARTVVARTNPLPRDPATGGVAMSRPAARSGPPRGAGRPPADPARPVRTDRSAPGSGQDAQPGPAANGSRVGGDDREAGSGRRVSGAVAAATSAASVAAGATGSVAKTAGRGVRTGLDTLGSGASVVAHQARKAARATADRAAERSASKAERRRFESMPDDLFEMQEASLTDVLVETNEQLESPVPIRLAPEAPTVPSRRESKLALAIVAGFVLLAALLGIWGLPQIGGLPSTSSAPASSAATAGTGAGATSEGTDSAPATDRLTPVAIVGAAGFEPTNGGQVASASAAKAYDGNPETGWDSKWFTTAKFGGLPIQGIGLIVDLGQETDVRRVTLNLPAAQDGTIYVANQASLDGAKALGTFANQKGAFVVDSANGAPVRGQLVIVYVTKLGPDGEGKFRAQVSEIQVSK